MICKKKSCQPLRKTQELLHDSKRIFSTIAKQNKKSYRTFARKQEFIHDPEQIIFQPLQKQAELMHGVGQFIFNLRKKHRN